MSPASLNLDRKSRAGGTALLAVGAFTLVELLVVSAIIGILLALVAPSLQGLMGTNGRRGGLSTAAAVLEHARLVAIESGTTAYVGLPINAANATNGYSHMIVFREPRPDDTNTNRVAVTRWQRLPNGVFFELGENFEDAMSNRVVLSNTLPRLGGEVLTNIPSIAFNRFGQLLGVVTNSQISLLVGEKVEPTIDQWRGGPSNFFELRIQPLTGRAITRDASLSTATP